jgi:hypothetical protein
LPEPRNARISWHRENLTNTWVLAQPPGKCMFAPTAANEEKFQIRWNPRSEWPITGIMAAQCFLTTHSAAEG